MAQEQNPETPVLEADDNVGIHHILDALASLLTALNYLVARQRDC